MAGDGTSVIEARHLTKYFKDFWMRQRAKAVDDLSFAVESREIFGLLGPNGSGKSTTIKLMLGLLRPSRGRVAVFGRPPSDVAVKKRIGYLPEESYLYPFLNARETLEYYGKLFGLDRRTRRTRADELLDMIGLTAAQHRPIREYSKGMQRRIGLAQALINDPDLLILDEPTTGLDPIGTRQVKDLILELGSRGKTILLSSHLLSDVEDVVDRMVILYGGTKREEGTTEDLLVSSDRVTIEADTLDEGTLEAIDELVRQRSGGVKHVTRVTKPRQTLESLFLDIVARAAAERVETSGASNSGATAEFLRADEEHEGDDLIDSLVSAEPERPTVPAASPARTTPEPSEPDVIESLVREEPSTEESSPAERPERPRPDGGSAEKARGDHADGMPAGESDVDRSLIDSLLDDEGEKP